MKKNTKKSAWMMVTERWSEFDMGFICGCGEELYIDNEEPEICPKCGRTYTLTVLFEVEEKEE